MDRRRFLNRSACVLAELGFRTASSLAQESAPAALTVENFHLTYSGEKGWVVGADTLKISGLEFPASSWGWIALNLAQGAVSAIGGMIFSAITNALFKTSQPDIGSLLQQQLDQFAHIVKAAFDEHDLAEAKTALATDIDLAGEYIRARRGAGGRLEHLIPSTAQTLRRLERLGYAGYPTYLQTSALRLTLLQDLAIKEGGGATENFKVQQERINSYQAQTIALIAQATNPASIIPPLPWNPSFFSGQFSATGFNLVKGVNVFGTPVQGFVQFQRGGDGLLHAVPPEQVLVNIPVGGDRGLIDWLGLRRRYSAQSVDLGAPIVQQLTAARSKLSQVAAQRLASRMN